MFTQVGRGAVLLTSMTLVACYIDVYATGKFPWQHAAETSTTVPPPEWTSDLVQPIQYVDSPVTQQQLLFMSGSKSDVAGSASLAQAPVANGQTAAAATPIFLSGSKSFSGQTTVLSGALNQPPANAPAEQKAPSFMGGSKTISLPPRLPETMTTSPPPPAPSKLQFMSGFKSPGPAVMPGSTISPPSPRVQTTPAGGQVKPAAQGSNIPNTTPQFMSGSKSPLGRMPTPQPAAPTPSQQQTTPSKFTPSKLPGSPAGSY